MPNLPATPTDGGAAWQTLLVQRFRYRFWLKLVGISGFMWLFFLGYFHMLRHPVYPVTTMPLTVVDDWVGFTPWALWPYVSLWVYVGIAPGLMPAMRPLLRYGAWAAALCAAGLACFYFWPTAVPQGVQPADAARHAGFAVLRGVDAAGNASPSLHVASAVFSAFWVRRTLRELGAPLVLHALSWTWCAAIVWSTLATKQHVALDVVAGTLLALVFAAVSLRFSPLGARVAGTPAR